MCNLIDMADALKLMRAKCRRLVTKTPRAGVNHARLVVAATLIGPRPVSTPSCDARQSGYCLPRILLINPQCRVGLSSRGGTVSVAKCKCREPRRRCFALHTHASNLSICIHLVRRRMRRAHATAWCLTARCTLCVLFAVSHNHGDRCDHARTVHGGRSRVTCLEHTYLIWHIGW